MKRTFAIVSILFFVTWVLGFFVFKFGEPVHLILLLAILNTIPVFNRSFQSDKSAASNKKQQKYPPYDYARINKRDDNPYSR